MQEFAVTAHAHPLVLEIVAELQFRHYLPFVNGFNIVNVWFWTAGTLYTEPTHVVNAYRHVVNFPLFGYWVLAGV